MTDNFVKIRPAIMAMAVGETIEFPIAKLKSVRTQASEIGAITERRYTTGPTVRHVLYPSLA